MLDVVAPSLLSRITKRHGSRVLHNALTPGQREALRFCWEAHGRPMVRAGERTFKRADGIEQTQDIYKGQLLTDIENLPWTTAMIIMGRGGGKSRLATEYARHVAETIPGAVIGIMGETATSTRQTLGFGLHDGIDNICPPWNHPTWIVQDQAFKWANKSIVYLLSSDAPEKPRSYEFNLIILDECAFYRQLDVIVANVSFALRAGQHPRLVATTTPRASGALRQLRDRPNSILVRGSLYDNIAFLPPSFVKDVEDNYKGTSLERAELWGDPAACDELEGALWRRGWLNKYRVREAPPLRKIVVGVDPAASVAREHDVAGIVVVGVGPAPAEARAQGDKTEHAYILEDCSGESGVLTPRQWASAAVDAVRRWGAAYVVEETNRGGALASELIKAVDPTVAVRTVGATQSKGKRATEVAAQTEAGRVHMVGVHAKLEDELCGWDPSAPGGKSPGRLDAAVWACASLIITAPPPSRQGELNQPGLAPRRNLGWTR
jgi:phage terminase large subunit-like protein